MTEGKNSEAHVKHAREKKILHIIILKRMTKIELGQHCLVQFCI